MSKRRSQISGQFTGRSKLSIEKCSVTQLNTDHDKQQKVRRGQFNTYEEEPISPTCFL